MSWHFCIMEKFSCSLFPGRSGSPEGPCGPGSFGSTLGVCGHCGSCVSIVSAAGGPARPARVCVSGSLRPNRRGKVVLNEWEETVAHRHVSAWYKCHKLTEVSAPKKFWLLCCSSGLHDRQKISKFWIWLLQGIPS